MRRRFRTENHHLVVTGADIGQHPSQNNQRARTPLMTSSTRRHHWPGSVTTRSKHVDDDDDDDVDADDMTMMMMMVLAIVTRSKTDDVEWFALESRQT
jgi:hypothetical protein